MTWRRQPIRDSGPFTSSSPFQVTTGLPRHLTYNTVPARRATLLSPAPSPTSTTAHPTPCRITAAIDTHHLITFTASGQDLDCKWPALDQQNSESPSLLIQTDSSNMPPRKQINGSATSTPMTRSMKRKQEELASAGDEDEQVVKPKRARHTAPDRDASRSRKRKAPEQDASESEAESDVASGPKKKQRIDAPKKTRASTRKKPTKGEGNPKVSSSRQRNTNDTAATPAVAANNQRAAQTSASQPVPAAAPRLSGRVRAQEQQQQQQSQQRQQHQQAQRETDPIAPEAREWLDMVKKIGCTAFRRHHNKLRNTLDPMVSGLYLSTRSLWFRF